MQKVSYMGNGLTTEFTFNFPYFENTNIVVTKNGTVATGYNIVGTSAGSNADIPYTGGKVVFEIAPTSLDNITIARSLPLARVVDYQPTAKITPMLLNQDANYLMEVLKDRKDELDTLVAQFADIANKESTTTLLAQISAIHNEIFEIDAKITALGDISAIHSNIATLDNRTSNLTDYVVASQSPTANNNYTWYRKHKSGWLEQGGITSLNYEAANQTQEFTCNFAQYFSDTNYTLCLSCIGGFSTSRIMGAEDLYKSRFNGFIKQGATASLKVAWYACGL